MSASAFILEAETAYSTTTPKATAAFNILQQDVLVAYGLSANNTTPVAISNSGIALAWTQQQVIAVASFGWTGIWTHVVTQSRAAVTITPSSTGVETWGLDLLIFRDSGGVGASSQTNNASGAPTLNLTTTAANSTIVVASTDWSAVDGASRIWRANAGPLTETTYFTNIAAYTAYGGYHADAGPIGTYAVGLTAPTPQKYATVAVEVKGLVPGSTLIPRIMRMRW